MLFLTAALALLLLPIGHCFPRIEMPRVIKNVGNKVGAAAHSMKAKGSHVIKAIGDEPSAIANQLRKQQQEVLKTESEALAAIRTSGQVMRDIGLAVNRIESAAGDAERLMQEMQPAVRDLDELTKSTSHFIGTAEPMLHQIDQAAEGVGKLARLAKPIADDANQATQSIVHLVRTAEPTLVDIDKAASSVENLAKLAVPAAQNLDTAAQRLSFAAASADDLARSAVPLMGSTAEAVNSTAQLTSKMNIAMGNLTNMLHDFDETAAALKPSMTNFGKASQRIDNILLQFEEMVQMFGPAASVFKFLIGTTLVLHICLLVGRLLREARLGRTSSREPLVKTDLSLLTEHDMSFHNLHTKQYQPTR